MTSATEPAEIPTSGPTRQDPTRPPDPPPVSLPPDLGPDAVAVPVPASDVFGEEVTTPDPIAPAPEDRPDEAARTTLRVPSAVNGELLVISGTVGRPCASVAVQVAGRELASVRTEADRFSLEVDTQALGVGQHQATVVCGDDGAVLATTTLSIVQPVSRASGAGSSIGIVAFLMLGLLALVSLPGPANQDDR